jgi:hypothetical protein
MKHRKTIFLMISIMGLPVTTLAEETQPVQQEAVTVPPTTPPHSSPRLQIGETKRFSGKLVANEWQKSGESYCQGGGKYYVLEVNDKRYTLESLRDPRYDQNPEAFATKQLCLAKWVGRTITIKGQEVVRYFSQAEHCPDPQLQCIVGDLTCSWIRISEILAKPPQCE